MKLMMRHSDNHKRCHKPAGDLHSSSFEKGGKIVYFNIN